MGANFCDLISMAPIFGMRALVAPFIMSHDWSINLEGCPIVADALSLRPTSEKRTYGRVGRSLYVRQRVETAEPIFPNVKCKAHVETAISAE